VPRTAGGIDLAAAVALLRARGLHALFVEGGGRTVSAFLDSGLVDRLQIAIAPLVTGRGRPGLTLAPRPTLADGLRPASRLFRMGRDVLFDCDLRASAPADAGDLPELIG
jgi:riboflavin biosynthesis pyrimidine reductase